MEIKFIDPDFPYWGEVPYGHVGTQTLLPMTQEEMDSITPKQIGFIWNDTKEQSKM